MEVRGGGWVVNSAKLSTVQRVNMKRNSLPLWKRMYITVLTRYRQLLINLSQPNPIHILTSDFPRMYVSFIRLSITASPKLSLLFTTDTSCVVFLHPQCVIVPYKFPFITLKTGHPTWRAVGHTSPFTGPIQFIFLLLSCLQVQILHFKFVPKQPETSASVNL